MKTVVAILFVLMNGVLFAQNTIFAGKITDGKGKPQKGAIVRVTKEGRDANVRSDDSGLFHTDIIAAGDYEVAAVVNGRTLKASNKVPLTATNKTTTYYYVIVRPGGLDVTPTQRDLFKETNLAKVRNQQKDVDLPVNTMRMQVKHDEKHPAPKERKLQTK